MVFVMSPTPDWTILAAHLCFLEVRFGFRDVSHSRLDEPHPWVRAGIESPSLDPRIKPPSLGPRLRAESFMCFRDVSHSRLDVMSPTSDWTILAALEVRFGFRDVSHSRANPPPWSELDNFCTVEVRFGFRDVSHSRLNDLSSSFIYP